MDPLCSLITQLQISYKMTGANIMIPAREEAFVPRVQASEVWKLTIWKSEHV